MTTHISVTAFASVNGKPLEIRHDLLPGYYLRMDDYGHVDLVEDCPGIQESMFFARKEIPVLIELLRQAKAIQEID